MEREKRTEVGERMKAVIGRDSAVLAIEIEKSEKKSKEKRERRQDVAQFQMEKCTINCSTYFCFVLCF